MISPRLRFVATISLVVVFSWLGSPAKVQQLSLDRELDSGVADGCALDVSPPRARSRPASNSLKVLPPETGLYVGTYQIPLQPEGVQRFAASVGDMPPIVFSFHDFFADSNKGTRPDKTFANKMEGDGSLPPLRMAEWLRDRGSVLALAWAVYCCDIESTGFWMRMKKPHDHINRILAGRHDDFIRETARMIRDWGGPIMLTLVPEVNWQGQFLFGADGRQWMDSVDNICNKYGDPTWPDGPERVRDVFMHVIDIFREEGAHNVTWFMYAASQYMAPDAEGQSRWLHPKYYYPGDDYIDWVGQSVYFTDPAWGNDFEETGSFTQVFLPGYQAWREVTSKPMFLPEFGMLASRKDDRRGLWAQTFQQFLKATPGVKAITIADSQLFASYFDIPLLSTNRNESSVVQQVRQNDRYFRAKLRLSRAK